MAKDTKKKQTKNTESVSNNLNNNGFKDEINQKIDNTLKNMDLPNLKEIEKGIEKNIEKNINDMLTPMVESSEKVSDLTSKQIDLSQFDKQEDMKKYLEDKISEAKNLKNEISKNLQENTNSNMSYNKFWNGMNFNF